MSTRTKIFGFVIATCFCSMGIEWTHAKVSFVDDTRKSASYTYIPGDRRDPFRSMIKTVPSREASKNSQEVSHFTHVPWSILGIMSGLNGTRAVLQDAKGHRYMVSLGDVLSPQSIRVVHLSNTTVTLEFFAEQGKQTQHFTPQTLELTFK